MRPRSISAIDSSVKIKTPVGCFYFLEPMRGIEPPSWLYESLALPLSYIGKLIKNPCNLARNGVIRKKYDEVSGC